MAKFVTTKMKTFNKIKTSTKTHLKLFIKSLQNLFQKVAEMEGNVIIYLVCFIHRLGNSSKVIDPVIFTTILNILVFDG